jgi:hypothetical protein
MVGANGLTTMLWTSPNPDSTNLRSVSEATYQRLSEHLISVAARRAQRSRG